MMFRTVQNQSNLYLTCGIERFVIKISLCIKIYLDSGDLAMRVCIPEASNINLFLFRRHLTNRKIMVVSDVFVACLRFRYMPFAEVSSVYI